MGARITKFARRVPEAVVPGGPPETRDGGADDIAHRSVEASEFEPRHSREAPPIEARGGSEEFSDLAPKRDVPQPWHPLEVDLEAVQQDT